MTPTTLRARIGACQGCGACLLTCPERAIRPGPLGTARGLQVLAGCTGCGECVEICPVDAIALVAAAEATPLTGPAIEFPGRWTRREPA